MERESGEEVERLNREVERSRLEAQRLTAEVEAAHLKAGAEASEHASKLRRQLEESQRRQETEVRAGRSLKPWLFFFGFHRKTRKFTNHQ